jgi:Ca2+-binding RTX toxin-like protein
MATIIGNDTDETLNGVAGEVNYIDGAGGNDQLLGGLLSDVLIGGAGDDYLDGSASDDSLWGDAGDDRLLGGGGDDTLDTDTGNDQAFGGSGDDWIHLEKGLASDIKEVFGDQGDDVFSAGLGTDRIDGGQGIDRVDYRFSSPDAEDAPVEAVFVDLLAGKGSGGFAEGDTYWSVEDVIGTQSDDVLAGNGAYNTIDGWLGNDTIRGGAGGDLLDGGAGIDWLSYFGSSGAVVVNLGTGQAVGGHAEGDTFRNFENLRGSKYGDRLSGDASANVLDGNQGFDKLFGRGGDDVLIGGAGGDWLWGHEGADRFVYNAVDDSTRAARDEIRDFHQADGDLVDVSAIDASVAVAGDQAFAFIATAAFSGVAGELRYEVSGGNATVFGDVDGDSLADLAIMLSGVTSLAASDFVV